MSCLNVDPLNKMYALWEQRAWGQACGELQELLGDLVRGRRKKGCRRAGRIFHLEYLALLKIATHLAVYPKLLAPLTLFCLLVPVSHSL